MIENNIESERAESKNIYEIKNYLSVWNAQKMSQFGRKSLIILPSVKNTHIAFFTQHHGYSQELVHFDRSGKRLGKQSFEYSKTSVCMLSDEQVVLYRQVIRYNGDYLDYICIWNLNSYQLSQCRYFGGDSQDYQIYVDLIVFKDIKVICLCQTRLTNPITCRLSYYEPQQIYNSKISTDKKKPIHSYVFTAKTDQSKNGFKVKKLNERGMVAFYFQHISDHLCQFQVYHYQSEQKRGQIIKYSFDYFKQDIVNGLKFISQICELQTDIMYVKLSNDNIQEERQRDYIVDNGKGKWSRIETQNKGPFNIQFISKFREIKDTNSLSTKPVQLANLLSSTYFLDHVIPSQQLIGNFPKMVFNKNIIYKYEVNNVDLSISETSVKSIPFTIQQLFAFFLLSIIPCPSQELLQNVVSLICNE